MVYFKTLLVSYLVPKLINLSIVTQDSLDPNQLVLTKNRIQCPSIGYTYISIGKYLEIIIVIK